jgi:MFS family permease
VLFVSFGPTFLIAHGLSQPDAWSAIVAIAIGGILTDRMGHATIVMAVSFIAFGLSAILAAAAPSPILMILIGAAAGLPTGAIMALPSEVLRRRRSKLSRRSGL